MGRPIKGRIRILAAAVLFIAIRLAEIGVLPSREVAAAPPETGTFHLKKYVDAGQRREATGLQENTDDPSNSLYGKEVVPDVVYEIYQTHAYINKDWVELKEPINLLNNGENYKTDAKGEIHITGLPLGMYEFKEVSAPDNVQINNGVYSFALPFKVGNESDILYYDVYAYPKNEWLCGSLSFTKVGDDGKKGLKNVKFAVYHEDGTAVQDTDGSALTVTTRLSGSAVVEDLQVGKYYLLETENPNTEYFKSSTVKYWFEIYGEGSGTKARSFYTNASMKKKIKDADGKDLGEGIIINYKKPTGTKTPDTKTPGTNPPGNSSPKTGDGTGVLWYALGLLGGSIAVLILVFRKKRTRGLTEE